MQKTHLASPSGYLVGQKTTLPRTRISPQGTVDDNPTWAGNAASVRTYQDVYGYWLESHIYSSASSPRPRACGPGLGGQNTGTLAQAGTAVGESGLSARQAWYELISGSTNIFKTDIPVTATPGGEFVAEVDYQAGGYYIFLANEYTGVSELLALFRALRRVDRRSRSKTPRRRRTAVPMTACDTSTISTT